MYGGGGENASDCMHACSLHVFSVFVDVFFTVHSFDCAIYRKSVDRKKDVELWLLDVKNL